ncbi:MAG: hypothetical protein D6775_10485, partial [Caldilineae bacterium]
MPEENPLTRRESQILGLLAEGLSNDEIANRLTISPNTVKVHVRNIFEKMGVQSRTEATMEAVRRGWIQVPGLPAQPDAETRRPVWPPLEEVWEPWRTAALLISLLLAVWVFVWARPVAPASRLKGDDFTSDRAWLRKAAPPRLEVARWSQRASMPIALGRAAAAVIDGRLYVVGGENDDGDLAGLLVYDPDLDIWQPLASRPVAARAAPA